MNDYEARRLENIKRNRALLLSINRQTNYNNPPETESRSESKRRRVISKSNSVPKRISARIASAPPKPSYAASPEPAANANKSRRSTAAKRSRGSPVKSRLAKEESGPPSLISLPLPEVTSIQRGWSSWTLTAPPPKREPVTGAYNFVSHPDFAPNKSPEEILREGCFGGSYFRPLFSRRLGIIMENDWQELPQQWILGLNIDKYLTNRNYDADVNKFKVPCGQTIEQWEANGWINHAYDVRGWFQWYCRYFMGRRCEDDDRQVSRWKKCVGETGRWRRMLLKKYVSKGVREVWNDGEDEDRGEVSPVMHQTCHHWAFEVKQDVLDDFWSHPK